MKNMMSLVRNCKLLLLSILLLSVAGCKKDVNEPQTIHGNQPRPSWVVTDESNLLSSMTAIIKVTTLNGQAIDDTTGCFTSISPQRRGPSRCVITRRIIPTSLR